LDFIIFERINRGVCYNLSSKYCSALVFVFCFTNLA
jgi:hypothetical protein